MTLRLLNTEACQTHLGNTPCCFLNLSANSWKTRMNSAPIALRLASGSFRPCNITPVLVCTLSPQAKLHWEARWRRVAGTHASFGAHACEGRKEGPLPCKQPTKSIKTGFSCLSRQSGSYLEQAQHALGIINLCHRQVQVLLKRLHDALRLLCHRAYCMVRHLALHPGPNSRVGWPRRHGASAPHAVGYNQWSIAAWRSSI